MCRRTAAAVALAACVGFARPVLADTITAGKVITDPGPLGAFGASFDLHGMGFSLTGGGEIAYSTCFPCLPGQTVTAQVTFNGTGAGIGQVNGRVFSPAYFNLFLPLVGRITFPTNEERSFFTISFPFSLTGGMIRFDSNPSRESFPPTLLTDIAGSGIATAEVSREPHDGPVMFDTRVITFNFTDPSSPSPTPEPATLTLLGSALAIGVARRFRRTGE